MKEPVNSKLTGHVWRTRDFTEEEKHGNPFEVETHRSRLGFSSKKVLFCERCGFIRGMNYPPPDEIVKHISVPISCDDFMISKIHDV